MGCSNMKCITNNVRGIKNSDKSIKIFEYLKNKFNSNGVCSFKKRIPVRKTVEWQF